MLQKAKTSLLRLLIVLCLVCCLVAVVLTAAACNKNTDPTIVSAEMSNGELVLKWSDGTETKLPLKGLDGTNGTPGAPGKDGETGTPGVGIQGVEWKDGKLHITFTDGNSTDVEITGEMPDICPVSGKEHDFSYASLHDLKPATCVSGAITVNICECGAAKVVEGKEFDKNKHVEVEHLGTKPTCTEAGREWDYCSACDTEFNVEEGEALGHTKYILGKDGTETADENWITVVDEHKNLCEDGGYEVLVCGRCQEHAFEERVVEQRGLHVVNNNWTMTVEPTETTKGELSGYCTYCKQNVTVEIPALTNDVKDTGESTEATCTTPGKTVWKPVVTGYDHSTWTGRVEKQITSAHVFEIDGEAVDLTKTYEIDTYKSFIRPISNEPLATCQQVGEGVFTCAKCKKTYKVAISGSHEHAKEDQGKKVETTCQVWGYTEYTCIHDEVSTHTYKVYDETYTSQSDWESHKDELHTYGSATISGSSGNYTAHQVCTVCGHENDLKVAYYEEKETVAATCFKPGVTTYKYWLKDETGESPEDGTFTETIAQLDHEGANGIKVADSVLKQTWDDQPPFNKGKVDAVIANADLPTCQDEGEGTFECTHCKQTYKVKVIGDHTYRDDGKEDGRVPATCTKDGYTYQNCTKCHEESARKQLATLPALGHDYTGEPTQVINHKDNDPSKPIESITFTWTCKNNCGEPKTVTGMPSEKHTDTILGLGKGYEVKEATCDPENGEGYVKFWYTTEDEPGVEKSIEIRKIPVSTTVHTLGGKSIDITTEHKQSEFDGVVFLQNADPEPTCDKAGEAVFQCETCKKTWKISITRDHEWTAETEKAPLTHEATCTEAGYQYRICKLCKQEVKEGAPIPATGHSFKAAEADITKPTTTTTGSVTYRCERCTATETVTLPALDKENYTYGGAPASCDTAGLETYTFVHTVTGSKDTYENVVITITSDALGHLEKTETSKEIAWTSKDGTKYYEGYICERCGKAIVEKTTQITGTFVLSIEQGTLGKTLYANGEMDSLGYYLATTEDIAEAATVTITYVDGKYTIKLGEKFVEIIKSGTHYNVALQTTQTADTYWKFDTELGIFTFELDGKVFYLGTYDKYNTFSATETSCITGENAKNRGVSQFVGEYIQPDQD